MTRAERVVGAAQALVGTRFRLHGRDPAFGLDCVGLAAMALRAGGFSGEIRCDYGLRGGDAARFCAAIDASGLTRVREPKPGDVILAEAGPLQFHIAVLVPGGVVHADALLRRVVERPGAPPWPVLSAWRLREG